MHFSLHLIFLLQALFLTLAAVLTSDLMKVCKGMSQFSDPYEEGFFQVIDHQTLRHRITFLSLIGCLRLARKTEKDCKVLKRTLLQVFQWRRNPLSVTPSAREERNSICFYIFSIHSTDPGFQQSLLHLHICRNDGLSRNCHLLMAPNIPFPSELFLPPLHSI